MAEPQKAPKAKPSRDLAKVESRPDGWGRFERAVDFAIATKPMHRPAVKKSRKKA